MINKINYKKSINVLCSIAYTLKTSNKTDYKIEGFFDYVVSPLEGFCWQDGIDGVDYSNKDLLNWAKELTTKKKKIDCSKAEFLIIEEGLCVQIIHHGSYDDEPASVDNMDKYLEDNGYVNDFSDARLHHEIYIYQTLEKLHQIN